ncbi:MAG: hypothetical protein JWO42_1981, partial [Chloroflexi bacterium]|nr:hypothetical protein [Chloroflexota bacterium]
LPSGYQACYDEFWSTTSLLNTVDVGVFPEMRAANRRAIQAHLDVD